MMDEFEALEHSIEKDGIAPSVARKLFMSAVRTKRADHWRLCLASFHVVGLRDGSTERLAHEADSISVDSVEDYARTYRLYRDIHEFYYQLSLTGKQEDPKNEGVYSLAFRRVKDDLRELRHEVHYTKWLIVANAAYTGIREANGRRFLTMPESLDALKSAADGSAEMFAAYVAGAEVSQIKALRKAHKALSQVLSFPTSRNKKRAYKKAFAIIEKEVSNDKNSKNQKAR